MFLRKSKLSYLEFFCKKMTTRKKIQFWETRRELQGTTVVKVANAVVMGVFTMVKKRVKKIVVQKEETPTMKEVCAFFLSYRT